MRFYAIACLILSFLIAGAQAVLNVTVLNVPKDSFIPVVVNVASPKELGGLSDVQLTLAKNLAISGHFKVTKSSHQFSEREVYQYFSDRKAEFFLDLSVVAAKKDSSELPSLKATVYDLLRKKVLFSSQWRYRKESLVRLGNKMTDLFYESVLGKKGFFDTQLAYVVRDARGGEFSLEISNVDGSNSQALLSTDQPILSTSWSNDGKRLAYVSYYKNYSAVFVRSVWKKKKLLRFLTKNGMIFSPAWSPDDSALAVTVSKNGNKDIYLIDLQTKSMQRLTKHSGVDTEPTWSPDGGSIYFSSNRSGTTQIYRYDLYGDSVEPVSVPGNYNAHPSISPDGAYLAMIHRQDGEDKLAIQSITGPASFRVIEHSSNVESPVFSPTGTHVIFSQKDRKNSTLIISTTDGSYFWRLKLPRKDLLEPSWSPILKF